MSDAKLEKSKILIIGMVDSIHVARWIEQFRDSNLDLVLFPSGPNRKVHSKLQRMSKQGLGTTSLIIEAPTLQKYGIVFYLLDRLILNNSLRGWILNQVMRRHDFALVHVLELQHAGYLVLRAKERLNGIPLLITNWGSDLYWYRRFRFHRRKLRELMCLANFYSCECHRDLTIAEEMGFRGRALPVIPNAGGLDIPTRGSDWYPPSSRNLILIKGYTGFVGRALRALHVVRDLKEILTTYEIVVYSASRKSRWYVHYLRKWHGMNIRAERPGLSHNEMLSLFSRARVYIGISLSDGISTSLLEAMSTGAFPIQTNTSCAGEWITSDSGSLVGPNDRQELTIALRRALLDDYLVDEAASTNIRVITQRARKEDVRRTATSFYDTILSYQAPD